MVRSLADRTFQLRFQQFQRQEQAKEDFGAEHFIEQLGVTALERERKEEIE